ncbi:Omp28-related outer membrane protein [Capnocytophaga sp.]|uniref:Omp28-related outer membrane protein n=1 Tax=Capnocytophaga sp. TaxID=44737 RepID=UPI0026DBACD9|nr:Omp28-related outer membrane protein [Capnocytophaga sp.]MDO5105034.1 Omp28-related outer membrane protein [Capnocytophaga sp.]
MKTKKIIAGLLIATSFFTLSCSKDETSSLQPDQQGNEKPQEKPEDTSGETPNGNPNEKLFVYKAYVEDITGTWCGHCPNVSRVLDHIKKNLPAIKAQIVPVAVHTGGDSNYDLMQIEQRKPIVQYYRAKRNTDLHLTGYPYFAMNRNKRLYASNAIENLDNFLKTKKTSPIGIKIESKLTETGGTISVAFDFKEKFENLKYSVFVVEDKCIDGQTNYTDHYGGSRYISNFEHNDVFRAAYGNPLGNELGSVVKNTEVKKENLQVAYRLLNAGKLKNTRVVVFVSDANDNVLNVQEAKANETQDYQYAN